MEAYTNITIKVETEEQAIKVANIMKRIASERTPEFKAELTTFIFDIKINENVVEINDSCSLISNTFCEMVPQIMFAIGRYDFGRISMDAYYYSCNCGYEATCIGRRFKNGNIRISLKETD